MLSFVGAAQDPDVTHQLLDAFMAEARKLDPIFLIVHQFHEFGPAGEGFDANPMTISSPRTCRGYTACRSVTQQMRLYRESQPGRGALRSGRHASLCGRSAR
jgi:hypothetical protein